MVTTTIPLALADEVVEAASRTSAFHYHPNLDKVRGYVLEHLEGPISLLDAASVAGLERRYFSTYFHRRVGIRFSDWLSAMRIARAIELIRERDCQLAWVSTIVGFGDRRTFQRAFKRWTGLTARDFKRRIRSGSRDESEEATPRQRTEP